VLEIRLQLRELLQPEEYFFLHHKNPGYIETILHVSVGQSITIKTWIQKQLATKTELQKSMDAQKAAKS
jgi:hypothetical protein